MKTFIQIILILVTTTYSIAQQQDWSVHFGGEDYEAPINIKEDGQGNVYVLGYFLGTTDFDPGPEVVEITANDGAVYVAKYTEAGNFVWVKTIHATENIESDHMTVDQNGNLVLSLFYRGDIDLDPNAGELLFTSSGTDMAIVKLTPNGELLWGQSLGSAEDDYANELITTQDNGIILSGIFQSSMDFDFSNGNTTLTPQGEWDSFLLKLSQEGTFEWVKQLGGSNGWVSAYNLSISQDRLLVTGHFQGMVDVDPSNATFQLSSTLPDRRAVFNASFDDNGNFLWAHKLEAEDPTSFVSITSNHASANGEFFIGGGFSSTVDFDPGIGTDIIEPIYQDAFILKLDLQGNYLWAATFGGADAWFNLTSKIVTDANNNVIGTGRFLATTDFNPDPNATNQLTSNGEKDAFLVKLDENGSFIHASSIGGSGRDVGTALSIDASDNIYLTSTFRETADLKFGPEENWVTSQGDADCFMTKLSSTSLGVSSNALTNTLFKIYPNPVKTILNFQGIEEPIRAISIYTSLGNLVLQEKPLIGSNVDVSSLSSGSYIIQIRTEKGFSTRKFIKK